MPKPIEDFRAQYPQYNDLSDDQLAGALHKKFFADMPREEVDSKLGISRLSAVGPFGEGTAPQEDSPLKTAMEEKIIARNDPGLLDTILRGAGNQFNLGFGPQVRSGIKTGFGLLGDYDTALEEDRAKYAGGKAAHPGAAIASEVGGAVGSALLAPEFQVARAAPILSGLGRLLPRAVPRITRATQPAASVGERLNRAATTGGIYGGISGVGNAQADNPTDAGIGGLIGAATGAVLGPAVSGAVSGLGAGARWAADRARSVLGPEGQAQRLVTRALEQDQVPIQTAQQRLGTAIDQGQPAIIADTGEAATRSLARTAANRSPVARQAIEDVTEPRFNQQGTRVAGFIRNLTGAGGDTTATREGLQAAARQANRPAYARAYAEGQNGVWDQTLETLTAAPAMQTAMRGAVTTGANRAAADGFRPPPNPFIDAADGTLQLAPGTRPTLQFWDHVKRNLDGAIGVAQRAGDNTKAGELQDLRTALLQQLDAAAPSYRGARQGAAGFFGMDDALDVGRNLARGIKMEYPDIARGLAGMNEAERRLAREGYVNSVMDQLTDIRDRRDVVNALPVFSTEKGRRVANMILGGDNAARLEDFIHVENIMNRTRQEVSGGSTTARQQFLRDAVGVTTEGTLVGGAGLAALYANEGDFTDPKTYLAPLLVMGARRAGQHFDRRVMEQVGRLLASDDPQQLNQGLRIVARNQGLRQALNYVDQMLQRPAAQQGQSAVQSELMR